MLSALKRWILASAHRPGWRGIVFNPFYLARRTLWRAIEAKHISCAASSSMSGVAANPIVRCLQSIATPASISIRRVRESRGPRTTSMTAKPFLSATRASMPCCATKYSSTYSSRMLHYGDTPRPQAGRPRATDGALRLGRTRAALRFCAIYQLRIEGALRAERVPGGDGPAPSCGCNPVLSAVQRVRVQGVAWSKHLD